MVYESASPYVYTVPQQQGTDFSSTAVYALAFCAGALASYKIVAMATKGTVVIGLAADSGCGKSTFMRRMTSIFGGEPKAPEGGNPESNTLLSDKTTVLCLDDYHCLDRNGRKEKNVTALAPEAQNFDLMYEQVKDLKAGNAVEKPLRVRLIQKAGNKLFDPAYILDKGSEVAWVPDGSKLKAASPGLKFTSSCEKYFDQDVVVLEMVGDLSKLDDVSYVEGQISDSGAKTDGELAKQMLDNASFPGSMNGTGLFQTICGLKIREVYENLTK